MPAFCIRVGFVVNPRIQECAASRRIASRSAPSANSLSVPKLGACILRGGHTHWYADRPVDGDRNQHREEYGVRRDLQTEIETLLKRDREERGHGSRAGRIGDRVVVALAEALHDLADENEQRE